MTESDSWFLDTNGSHARLNMIGLMQAAATH